jgi:hypothetical protein
MNAVSGNRADVIMEVKNDGVFTANSDVAHEANFRMKTGAIQDADGGNFQVLY